MLVKILEDSEQKEFVVCQGSEFARVGRKGIIFKVKACFFLSRSIQFHFFLFVDIVASSCRPRLSC